MCDIYNTIIGTISFVVGVFSLIFSIVGYCASKKASMEAQAAKEETANVKKMIEKINYIKETKLSFQEDLLEACNEEKRIDKAAKLLSVLKRIEKGEKGWEELELRDAINRLESAVRHLSDEVSWEIGNNTNAMAKAEGIAKAYIDYLRGKISEMTEE